MGIKSQLHPTYSLALGSSEVNLLELSSAYGTLATQGVHTQTHGIRRILNRSGEIVYAAESKPKRVLDPGSAAIATWMLRNVVQAGTGGAAQLADRPVAGKTGTSDESRDLWFIGYIPQLVTGVWLGNDNNQPTWGSSSTAAYTWRKFMLQAVEEMPIEKFPERPKLEGRKGSIKAKPIKPKRVVSGRKGRSGGFGRQTVEENSENYRSSGRRRYRRRSRQQQENQSPPTSLRRSRPNRVEESPNVNESERYNRLLQRLQQRGSASPRTESVPRRRDRPPVVVKPLPPKSAPQSRSVRQLESDD
jgi:penicillin-binding protein 1A